jgi:hypothetical protein
MLVRMFSPRELCHLFVPAPRPAFWKSVYTAYKSGSASPDARILRASVISQLFVELVSAKNCFRIIRQK